MNGSYEYATVSYNIQISLVRVSKSNRPTSILNNQQQGVLEMLILEANGDGEIAVALSNGLEIEITTVSYTHLTLPTTPYV